MNNSKETLIGLSILFCVATLSTVTPAQAAVYNVKNFGAVGNGSADDTVAIELAIAAAEAVPSDSTVEFPPGTYRYTNALRIRGIKLKGVGAASLLSANTNSDVEITGESTEIRDLTFVNVLAGGGDAIKVKAANFVIENNTFIRGFLHDISVEGVNGGTISKNTINVSQFDHAIGIDIKSSSASITVSGNTMVSGETMQSVHTRGVHIESSSNIMLTGNGCTKLYSAIEVVNSQKVTVQSNNTSDVQFSVVGSFNSKETVASNNFSGISGKGAGIFDSGSGSQVIRDNVIKKTLDGVDITECNGLQVLRNQLSNLGETGVDVGPGQTVVISENTVDSAKVGLSLKAITGLLAEKNRLNSIQTNAIYSAAAAGGATTITENVIMDAGLSLSNPTPAAVIYVNSPSASGITITDNSYNGKTKNLQYFIWCKQGPPLADVSGNKTNTMLPNRIGS